MPKIMFLVISLNLLELILKYLNIILKIVIMYIYVCITIIILYIYDMLLSFIIQALVAII